MDIQTVFPFYEAVRMIFVILDIFFLGFFIFIIIKAWKFVPDFAKISAPEKIYTLGNVVLQERWESIIGRSNINSMESTRLAILDADNMIDELLNRMGVQGGNITERLENLSPDDFSSLSSLWSAHKIRNRIVHEPDFTIAHEDAQKVIADYGSFLKEIGVIEQK
ncbi:MAG TPA: hypothetical protein VMV71_03280 [Candidatus Paceibacterota bacterium]|nr:hypothetical protein [Candidatus Paceibacterota bacterium]